MNDEETDKITIKQEQDHDYEQEPEPEHITKMREGCVNDRVRIVFWDEYADSFVAVTPEFLLVHGAPFNADLQEYLEYNSTHIVQ